MTDRNEIFDYLRNRQKAAEIEAKVNGINLWVLLGAIAVVAWQLIGSVGAGIWDRPELVSRMLLCAESLYMLSLMGTSAPYAMEDVRYSQWTPADMESPFLVLFIGGLLLFPPSISIVLVGVSWGSAILVFFATIFVVISLMAIGSRLIDLKAKTEKFPKPVFGQTIRASVLADLLFGIAFAYVILEQGMFVWNHREVITVDLAKQLTLLVVLYLMVLTTVTRKLHSNGIAWTYFLETELLLGTISTEVAARRIEYRGLGPRLQDVMNRFFDDMDRRISEIDSLFEQCRSRLESVKDVPLEYRAERASRIQDASQALSEHIDTLSRDCSEFEDYLRKIEEKNTGTRKVVLAPLLTSLKARHGTYAERLRNAKIALKTLVA